MMFPVYNYKTYHSGNKNRWPIQPNKDDKDINKWNKAWSNMLEKNYTYCQNWNWIKEMWFIVVFKIKGLSHCYLPSEHIYWRRRVLEQDIKTLNQIKEKLYKCRGDYNLIKVHFNSNTTIDDIEKDISKREKDIKNRLNLNKKED